jgi:thiamine-monophosphate kinase
VDEFERIAAIERALGGRTSPEILRAIGDDAAILAPASGKLVWTIDACVEGVHFRRELLADDDVGYRATVAAASDVLAMGATPIAALAAWTLPEAIDEPTIVAIARGQREAGDRLGLPIVGGNLSNGAVLSITTTVVGRAAVPIERRGARAGDRVILVGPVGHAAVGLVALLAGKPEFAPTAVAAWRRPPVHLAALGALAEAHAMIDVSDGLAQDLEHVAAASGVAVVIDLDALRARRSAEIVAEADRLGVDLDRCELAGGEDYALVATIARDAALPEGADVIGWCEVGAGVSVLAAGRRSPPPRGHVHGRGRQVLAEDSFETAASGSDPRPSVGGAPVDSSRPGGGR